MCIFFSLCERKQTSDHSFTSATITNLVAQSVDGIIHWKNHYSLNNSKGFSSAYPQKIVVQLLDGTIQSLNSWYQDKMHATFGFLVLTSKYLGVEPGTTWNKSSQWSEQDPNSGSPDFKSSSLTTRPHCLPHLPEPCSSVIKAHLRGYKDEWYSDIPAQ